jgi:uncharacterized membrane protein
MVDFFHNSYRLPFALLVFSISGATFWPYFAGGAILAIGIAMAGMGKVRQAHGLDKLILFGPLLFAIPMAIFGADHFTFAKAVAGVVPSWIPAHLFWVYFVGVSLIAAAISLATKIQSRLAAALLGIMIFLFVLLIHVPNWFAMPSDPPRLTLLLRDLALSAGAMAFAASRSQQKRAGDTPGGPEDSRSQNPNSKLIVASRFLIAISIGVFGIDQYLHPTFAPGIPPDGPVFLTMPAWIPGHVFWAYVTGTIFVVSAVGLMTRKHARSAATVLGLTVLALALFVYLPLTVAEASDIANGLNYLAIHFALAGAVLLLAGSLPAIDGEYAEVAEHDDHHLRTRSKSDTEV